MHPRGKSRCISICFLQKLKLRRSCWRNNCILTKRLINVIPQKYATNCFRNVTFISSHSPFPALPSNQDFKREEWNNFLHNAHVSSLIHSSQCTQQISHNKTIIDFGKRNRPSLSQQNHQKCMAYSTLLLLLGEYGSLC